MTTPCIIKFKRVKIFSPHYFTIVVPTVIMELIGRILTTLMLISA